MDETVLDNQNKQFTDQVWKVLKGSRLQRSIETRDVLSAELPTG